MDWYPTESGHDRKKEDIILVGGHAGRGLWLQCPLYPLTARPALLASILDCRLEASQPRPRGLLRACQAQHSEHGQVFNGRFR